MFDAAANDRWKLLMMAVTVMMEEQNADGTNNEDVQNGHSLHSRLGDGCDDVGFRPSQCFGAFPGIVFASEIVL